MTISLSRLAFYLSKIVCVLFDFNSIVDELDKYSLEIGLTYNRFLSRTKPSLGSGLLKSLGVIASKTYNSCSSSAFFLSAWVVLFILESID